MNPMIQFTLVALVIAMPVGCVRTKPMEQEMHQILEVAAEFLSIEEHDGNLHLSLRLYNNSAHRLSHGFVEVELCEDDQPKFELTKVFQNWIPPRESEFKTFIIYDKMEILHIRKAFELKDGGLTLRSNFKVKTKVSMAWGLPSP